MEFEGVQKVLGVVIFRMTISFIGWLFDDGECFGVGEELGHFFLEVFGFAGLFADIVIDSDLKITHKILDKVR